MDEYLQLAEWRRTVAELFERWRHESQLDAEAAWQTWRDSRDELFRSHPQSPLPTDQRARFGGLSYFDYDPAYRMMVQVQPMAEAETSGPPALDLGTGFGGSALMQLPSSGPTPFSFQRLGRVALTGPLDGQALPVFWMEGYAGGLFIPFRDATSGTDTYAAGRYLLDTVKGADHGGDPNTSELLLDFNLAYHPSCTYDPKWNCPLAPPDSRLSVPVTAGERLDAVAPHD